MKKINRLTNKIERLEKELRICRGDNDEDLYIIRIKNPGEKVTMTYCGSMKDNGDYYEKSNIPKNQTLTWDEYIKESKMQDENKSIQTIAIKAANKRVGDD